MAVAEIVNILYQYFWHVPACTCTCWYMVVSAFFALTYFCIWQSRLVRQW